jgi:hypothetical protein
VITEGNMKNILAGLAVITYVIVGIIQFIAMIGGLSGWLGSTFLAVLLSFVFGWMPIIGTIAGISYSVNAWDWNICFAILFFCFPLILMLAGGIGAVGAGILHAILRRIKKKDEK